MIQLEREDRQHQIEKQLCRDNTGKCCGGTFDDTAAEFNTSHGWRGWVVWCLICGSVIQEVDE